MAIEIKTEKKFNFSLLFIIFLLAVLGWFVWNFLKPIKIAKKPRLEELLPPASQELIQAQLDINKILNHPVFQGLVSHISWPINVPALGRQNPFQPF